TRQELTPYEIPGQPGRTYYRNAGAAVRQGMEASAQWFPVSGLALLAAYNFSDYYFDTYITPAGDFGGNRLPVLPRHHGQVELRWNHKGGLFAIATARFTGELFADDANTTNTDPVCWLKSRIGWRRGFGPLSLELFAGIDNLGDTRYFNNVRPNAAAGRYFEPGAGRTWLGGISAVFIL
ncbi:MAG: TonB-dependent receptor, partial [Thermoanaerobaculia bacterium]|nr:TonB-dependent receptor [Thermoanaerobaculia bacterium]